jgi:hypothetical protein
MGKIKESNKDLDVKFDPELDIAEQIKRLVEKKRRNLEKRKNKLEEYKKRATHEKLLPEQEEALKSFSSVQDTLITIQHLLDQIQLLYSQQARWLKKEQKANLKKQAALKVTQQSQENDEEEAVVDKENVPVSEVVDIPKEESKPEQATLPPNLSENTASLFSKYASIYRLLQCFGDENVRSLFVRASEQETPGVVPLTEDELGWLDELSDVMSPLTMLQETSPDSAVDVFGCHAPLTSRQVQDVLDPSFKQLASLLSSTEAPMLSDGTTFKQVNDLCTRLVECEFFQTWTPKPVAQNVVEIPTVVASTNNYEDNIKPSQISTTYDNILGVSGIIPNPSAQSSHLNTSSNGGVERMLQTLGNAYQFIQVGTPEVDSQDTVKFIRPGMQTTLPSTGATYWSSEEQTAVPQQVLHHSSAAHDTQCTNVSWENDRNHEIQSYQEESHLQGPSYENVKNLKHSNNDHGHEADELLQAPTGNNHSWADRVRLNYGNKETVISKSFDNSSCFPPNNGDVFSTATQSQFISNSAHNDRRGGRGSGRGYSNGFRGRDNYRGSGNGFIGQRGRGRSSGQRI